MIELVGHLAWPLTVLILAYLGRNEIRKIVTTIGDRIAQKNTNVQIGKEGIKIETQLEEYRSKVEGQEIDIEQVKSLVMEITSAKASVNRSERRQDYIDADLRKLADEYVNVGAQDWRDRVRIKDDIARKMANHVITNNVGRDLLAVEHHEGLILALAATIHSLPQQGDADRLLRVAHETNRLHVRYRIVLAFNRLIERGMTDLDDIERIRQILNNYEHDADEPLVRRITATRTIINQVVHESKNI